MTGHQFAFALVAAATIVSAALVVTLPNILRSALFLAFTFLGVAALYVLANAEFVAVMQVLIYVGAITVLIMFAVVLTQQLMGARIRQVTQVRWLIAALPVTVAAFAFLVASFVRPFAEAVRAGAPGIAKEPAAADASTLQEIARLLLQPYVLPFELASLILLAALVGAIVIAKEDKE